MYKRILLKLSGEALAAGRGFGVDVDTVHKISMEIADIRQMGIEVAIVVGGGNFFRGVAEQARHMDRVSADHMGMLGTVINALAFQDSLEKCGVHSRVTRHKKSRLTAAWSGQGEPPISCRRPAPCPPRP